jgi:uncharacterized membrane protein
MQRIPLTAHAQASDGPCGELSGLVVSAEPPTLEYYVVRDTTPGHPIERLVPRARLDPAAIDMVRLDCTRDELGKMQPLSVQEYQQTDPKSSRMGIVDSERPPEGTSVLRQTQKVEATNGNIGKLVGIVIDDEGRITHFYTRLDKRGSPELFLPVSAVSYTDRWTVFLLLDKHQLESLPTLPALTNKSGEPVHKHMELVAKVYESPTGASEALEHLRQAQHGAEHPIQIREAVVLVRLGDGPPKVDDKGPSGLGKGAAMGVAAGGLLAMLGPIGLVAGAVAGGAVGGFAGSRIDLGFPDAFLQNLQQRLKPDHSALLLLIEHQPDQDPEQVKSVLEGAISQSTMVDTLVQEMLAAEQTSAPATSS